MRRKEEKTPSTVFSSTMLRQTSDGLALSLSSFSVPCLSLSSTRFVHPHVPLCGADARDFEIPTGVHWEVALVMKRETCVSRPPQTGRLRQVSGRAWAMHGGRPL